MAVKVLGQLAPASGVYTGALYFVPAGKECITSTLSLTNRTLVDDTVRIRVAVGNAASDNKQWLMYDVKVYGGTLEPVTIGLTLGAGDYVYVGSANGNITFQLFGEER